jgi:hypothetical protein
VSGLSRREINALIKGVEGGRLEDNWMQSARSYVEPQQDLMLCTFNPKDFTERLIAAVNIAIMPYRDDIDQLNDERRRVRNDIKLWASSIITND